MAEHMKNDRDLSPGSESGSDRTATFPAGDSEAHLNVSGGSGGQLSHNTSQESLFAALAGTSGEAGRAQCGSGSSNSSDRAGEMKGPGDFASEEKQLAFSMKLVKSSL